MDPHVDSTPGLALPQPSSERGAAASQPYPVRYEATPAQGPEVAAVVAEVAPSLQPAAPSLPPMAPLSAAAQSQAPVALQPDTVSTNASVPADDSSDALDEEWINKAKAIVERTKTDPYTESRELGKAKADYLRIRYNKQIKVAEDHQ